jgi:hypothetical protein
MNNIFHELEIYTTKTNGPWHIRRDDRIVGPYTLDQIMDFATNGKILSGDCLRSSDGTWASFDDPQIAYDQAIADDVVDVDTNVVGPASKANKSSALPNWISFILTKAKSIISRLNIDQTLADSDHLAVEGVEFTVIEQFLDHISSGYQGGNAKYKGDVFEALSKYYLENHPDWKNRFRAVWLWSERPSRYQWGGIDKGVDIIAESHEGFLWAIQCKGYKLSNAVNHGDIASFLAESSRPEVHTRLLMTTTDKIGKHAEETIRNQQIPVQVLKRTDFKRHSFRWPARLKVKGKTVEFQPSGLASGQGLSKQNRKMSNLNACLICVLLLSCCCCSPCIWVLYNPLDDTTEDIVSERKRPDERKIGGISYIKDAPYRWNTGPTWNFRWLFSSLERLEGGRGEGTGHERILQCERDGDAQRLSFGTRVRIWNIVHGFKYHFDRYEIEILEGGLKGQRGWTDRQSIHGR